MHGVDLPVLLCYRYSIWGILYLFIFNIRTVKYFYSKNNLGFSIPFSAAYIGGFFLNHELKVEKYKQLNFLSRSLISYT